MATFTPPTVYDVPAILPTSMGEERRLFRYFKNRARHVMVFALSDGTLGEEIKVKNSNSGKEIMGIITGTGEVTVK